MVTNMRLLAGVGPGVDGQSAPLNEALVAILDRAMVRSLVGMYPIMATEVRLSIKRLATMLPRAVEIAAISRSHDCEWPVGRSSAGDEIRLRGRQKRVAGAKRQATGDKKIGVLEGLEGWRKIGRGEGRRESQRMRK